MHNHTTRIHHSDERIKDIYSLRYKVYCQERGFERPEDHPGGLERDEYDPHASHFAIIRSDDNQVIGTVRIIFYTGKGFPLEKHARINRRLLRNINLNEVGEVSRLALSKEYRRALKMPPLPSQSHLNPSHHAALHDATNHEIVLGLYRCIYRESCNRKLTHLIAIMAEGLYRLLKKNGFIFTPMGPPINYHGLRRPYICNIQKTMQHIRIVHPDTYRLLTSS